MEDLPQSAVTAPSLADPQPNLQPEPEGHPADTDFAGDEDDDIPDAETDQRPEDEDEVEFAVAQLVAGGFEFMPIEPRRTYRMPGEKWYRILSTDRSGQKVTVGRLPRISIPAFLEEKQENFILHEDGLGLSSPDGRFVELMISRDGVRHGGYLPSSQAYVSPRSDCPSAELEPDHEGLFPTLFGRKHAHFRPSLSSLRRRLILYHVGNRRGECIEVSSPTATLAAPYFELVPRPFLPTR